jgi:hypothetical protein
MEYNLLKTIEPNFMASMMMPNSSYPNLTNFPAIDFVNPGVGQITQMYSFYVPLFNDANIHKIQKQDENELEQIGLGKDITEPQNNETSDDIQIDNDDPLKFNERKRKLLGEGVFDSFMHPKFKTKTISLEKKSSRKEEKPKDKIQTKAEKRKKNVSHHFEFY